MEFQKSCHERTLARYDENGRRIVSANKAVRRYKYFHRSDMQHVNNEGLQRQERFTAAPAFTRAACEAALQYILQKIEANLTSFGDRFPTSASHNLVYPLIHNTEWTASFWTGMLWLAYDVTGEAHYRTAAERHLDSFRQHIEHRQAVDHHDLGFLYTLSCVAAYRITGNDDAKRTALKAVRHLSTRFLETPGIIQAWGALDDPGQRGRMIIDCLMNLPLLYWATQVTGDPRYATIASRHAAQTANYIVRTDASTFHTFYLDAETGQPRYGNTHQGYSDDSCWARGQAWGMYGFPLSYRYTRDRRLVALTEKLSNYFLNRLPDDLICYWDLIFTSGSEERDSSAAAIAACGLLEFAGALPLLHPQKRLYEHAAVQIVQSLTGKYTTRHHPESNGILRHGVYSKPGGRGVDECCIWGDYFYTEAVVRLLKVWQPYW